MQTGLPKISKCFTDAVQRNVVRVNLLWDVPKVSTMECAFGHSPPEECPDKPVDLLVGDAVLPLAIHGAGHCTAVVRVVPFLSCQRRQLHEKPLGVHVVPAWLSVLLPTVYQWQQCLLFLHSFGHCLDQFLSWHGGVSVPLLDARMAWLVSAN